MFESHPGTKWGWGVNGGVHNGSWCGAGGSGNNGHLDSKRIYQGHLSHRPLQGGRHGVKDSWLIIIATVAADTTVCCPGKGGGAEAKKGAPEMCDRKLKFATAFGACHEIVGGAVAQGGGTGCSNYSVRCVEFRECILSTLDLMCECS